MSSPSYPLSATTGAAATVWNVWVLLFGMGLLMLGNGMQGSLLGLRAADAGFSSTVTGLVMAVFAIYRMTRTAAFTPQEQSPYAPMPMSDRTGELAQSWVEEYLQEPQDNASESERNAKCDEPSKDSGIE